MGWQQVSVGRNYSGSACDVLVSDTLLQFWVGNELLKTVARTSTGEIRTKRAGGTAKRTQRGAEWDTSTGGEPVTDQPVPYRGSSWLTGAIP